MHPNKHPKHKVLAHHHSKLEVVWQKGLHFLKRHSGNLQIGGIIVISAGFILLGVFAIWVSTFKIPDFKSFDARKIVESTKIYDRTGEILLYDINQGTKRTVVPFEDISRHLKNATVAIEDSEFYQHYGIEPKAIARAILVNLHLKDGYVGQGGSTITQQVVKNSILTGDKTITRKLKEWVLSLKIERVLNKEQILSLYLNETPYGGNLYGVEEASRAFFGKKASAVTLAEAAYIAALPQAPSFYSPYGQNKEKLEQRKNLVLKRMLENKFIDENEYKTALAEKVIFTQRDSANIRAPHFVFFIKDYLDQKYGERVVEQSGFKVITSLDYPLQQKAEELAKKHSDRIKAEFNGDNVALVAIDPKTGQILSMVGSRDYFDTEIDGNFNVALAHRQPGSSFKPFVYATAFKEGYTPETVLFDVKTEFSLECSPTSATSSPSAVCYSPRNYDGHFRGPITIRSALGQSINIPAIKTLYLVGPKDALQTARDMGIESLEDASRYGLTLVLGGGEVSPLEMTSAYSVFANNGVRNAPTGILRIEDSKGNVIESFEPHPATVLPENVALQISDILSDDTARTPAFRPHSLLYFAGRHDVAVKTGTTNDSKDAWIMGYTPNITVGIWAGNNSGAPMEQKVASTIVAPFLHEFMDEILRGTPDQPFKKPQPSPDGLKPVLRGIWQAGQTYTTDAVSGKLATEYTPQETRKENVVTQIHDILYWVDKDDPRGPAPTNPAQDPQFERWEYGVREWVKTYNLPEETISSMPTLYDDVHVPENMPKIVVRLPQIGKVYPRNSKISVVLETPSKFPVTKASFFLNGEPLGSVDQQPLTFSFIPEEIQGIQGENDLRIVVYDSVFNRAEVTQKLLLDVGGR
ncbi:PBP1A family penicillin-binding protein [Patescibacteria group bacterium]|nr:MAG: PBP1A family penicillin-binding protein [Patescibacteria group bacterium]